MSPKPRPDRHQGGKDLDSAVKKLEAKEAEAAKQGKEITPTPSVGRTRRDGEIASA